VPAAEQARHDRLRDAGGQRGGNRGIGGAPAGLQDLGARGHRRGGAGCDGGRHFVPAASTPAPTKPPRGNVRRSPRHSDSTTSNSRSRTGRASMGGKTVLSPEKGSKLVSRRRKWPLSGATSISTPLPE